MKKVKVKNFIVAGGGRWVEGVKLYTPQNAKNVFFEQIKVNDTRFGVFGTRLRGCLKSEKVKLEKNSKSLEGAGWVKGVKL